MRCFKPLDRLIPVTTLGVRRVFARQRVLQHDRMAAANREERAIVVLVADLFFFLTCNSRHSLFRVANSVDLG
jgi:hypothetical protein